MLNNEKRQIVITQRILRYSKNIFRSALAMFLVMALFLTMPHFPFNYGIAEAYSTQSLWNLDIGDKVVDNSWQWEFRGDVNYSGVGMTKPVIWIVVAKNHYGAGSGVTLLSEELIGRYVFDNSTNRGHEMGSNHWGNSGTANSTNGLRPWLNSTGIHSGEGFYNAFSSSFKSSITTVTLPNKEWQYGNHYTTQDKVFIPSNTELGDVEHFFTYQIGTVYPYFSGATDIERRARLGGTFWHYWTRSPFSLARAPYPIDNPDDTPHMVQFVELYGNFGGAYASHPSEGVRPALNLRFDTQVSRRSNSAGVYEINPRESSHYVDIDPAIDFYKIFAEEYLHVWENWGKNALTTVDIISVGLLLGALVVGAPISGSLFVIGMSLSTIAGITAILFDLIYDTPDESFHKTVELETVQKLFPGAPISGSLFVIGMSLSTIAGITAILFDLIYDTPDESFHKTVELETVQKLFPYDETSLAANKTELMNNLLKQNAIWKAILITLERLQSAEQANEMFFVSLQAKALSHFTELLINNQQDLQGILILLEVELNDIVESNHDVIEDEVNRFAAEGLNDEEWKLFEEAGITSAERQIIEEILALYENDDENLYEAIAKLGLWANWIDETALPDLEQGVLVIKELLDSILLAKTNDIENLILEIDDTIDSRNINRGQGNALKPILSAAMRNLDLGNTNAAIKQLQAFINLVNAYVRTERLEAEVGNYWIDTANQAKEIFILLIE